MDRTEVIKAVRPFLWTWKFKKIVWWLDNKPTVNFIVSFVVRPDFDGLSAHVPPSSSSVLVHVLNSSLANRAVNEDGTAFVNVMVNSFFIFVNYPNSSLIIVFRVL